MCKKINLKIRKAQNRENLIKLNQLLMALGSEKWEEVGKESMSMRLDGRQSL